MVEPTNHSLLHLLWLFENQKNFMETQRIFGLPKTNQQIGVLITTNLAENSPLY